MTATTTTTTTTQTVSPSSKVLRVPPADPATAAAHFHRRFTFEADVADVHADVESGAGGFVLVDSRSAEAWEQGHVPGAVHLPTDEIPARAAELVVPGSVVVTYCWGPGCNGATRAAYAFASAGYAVKEMLGGFEYWSREGFPVEDSAGARQSPPDPLTAPVAAGAACGC
ncbi:MULTISPECIES: rhodanese-like domain-containing protein [unclassified Streptomyces]|uniref:rhodanese-like domain-containing protein n=1 Tax=unclassified Streptomyces TaxID=2593676 RepID=UPI002E2C2CA7|nr:rhodanese-like domain-containing protein [Streptomyces sp. NBC_00272]